MQSTRFDRISKAFAGQPLSRTRALAAGSAGAKSPAPSSVDQNATPVPEADHGPTMLFVQTYQSGSIAPKDGEAGRYTLTLDNGSGQTVYFSNRPDRIVGSQSTPDLLEGLGFYPDNPPNAALVVETGLGESDVAVVELFNPVYDPVSHGVTYEIEVLANWQRELDLGFTEAPTDLATLAPSFGAAQLFIDDCWDKDMHCVGSTCQIIDGDPLKGGLPRFVGDCTSRGSIENSAHDGFCYSWGGSACLPCAPWFSARSDSKQYWNGVCNERFPDVCQGECIVDNVCASSLTSINC